MNDNLRNYLKNRSIFSCPGGPARLYIKRFNDDGYESEWRDISHLVTKFPKVTKSIGDDSYLGEFITEKTTATFNNSHRGFPSLFNRYIYLTKTIFKMEVIYQDGLNEIIADTQYYFLYGDVTESKMDISVQLHPLMDLLNLEVAYGVQFVQGDSLADMCKKLLHKSINGVRLFDRFLEGSTDSEKYIIPDSNFVPEDISKFQNEVDKKISIYNLISRYCMFMGRFLFVNSDGNFEMSDGRDVGSIDEWHFNWLSSHDEYGNNVKFIKRSTGLDSVYNQIYITYGDDILHVKVGGFTPGDNSIRDVYGIKKFEGVYTELSNNTSSLDTDETEVSELANRIYNLYSQDKKKYVIDSACPLFLEPLDKVVLNAQSQISIPAGKKPAQYGISKWGDNVVYASHEGPINELGKELMVTSMSYDINRQKFTVKASEI